RGAPSGGPSLPEPSGGRAGVGALRCSLARQAGTSAPPRWRRRAPRTGRRRPDGRGGPVCAVEITEQTSHPRAVMSALHIRAPLGPGGAEEVRSRGQGPQRLAQRLAVPAGEEDGAARGELRARRLGG